MAQVVTTAQPTEGDYGLDTTGLCLLSLDGGGVRGLATLYVLRGIMDRLNHERENRGLPHVKPCDIFDLIGGTSTGGLIAIMLGRLEMDVDECISTYSDLIAEVFSEKKHWLPFNLLVTVQSRFDSKKLKAAVEKVIRDRGLDPLEQLDNGQERGCKVFVCATSKDLYHIKRLRSYKLPGKKDEPVTIIQAALATSAATSFFDPVLIGACEYADGALGANNPVDEVEAEAADLWCPETADLQSLVKCFLSVGTGNPGEKPVGDRVDQLARTLVSITTETEKTATKFLGRWRRAYELKRYFRLNVQQGLQDVGLEEYKKQPVIQRASEMYLDHYEQVSKVKECVGNLAGKQNPASPELQVSLFTALLLHEADDFIREECYSRGQLHIERLSRQLVPMEQCYINLGIIHQLGERPIIPPGPQTSEFSLQRRLKVDGPIEDHRIELSALFDPRRTRSGDLKNPRRIFIRGRAGVGKSTLCKKIVHGFLNDGLWGTLFDRVLWIPLRNLRARENRDRYDLTELFRDEFFSQHSKRDALAEALRNTCDKAGGGNSLFVLDGLDEIWQDLAPDSDLSRFVHYLLNCPNVIVTSRPSAVLPTHVDSFDLELETIGFRPEQVLEYVRKVEPARAEEIQSFLDAHPLIQGLVRIPIQLDALCYAWDDVLEDVPDTMSDLYRIIENSLWRKDLGRLRKTVEGRMVNEKQRLYKTQVKKIVGDERRFVESIAFTGLYNDVIVFNNRFRDLVAEHFDPPPGMLDDFLLKISYLRASDTRRGEQNQTYHFLHLTFQEYFAAQYFVRKWTENGTMLCLKLSERRPRMMDAHQFLREYKYSPRYNIMWRFVTGLLRAECDDQGDHVVRFFNSLQEEPVDLLGPTHERLVTHCLNEISLSDTTPAIVSLRNILEQHLSKWLVFQCTRPRSWFPVQGTITLASEMEFPLPSLLAALHEEGDEFRRTLLLSMPPERGVAPPVVKAITSWVSVDISGHLAHTLVNYFMRSGEVFPADVLPDVAKWLLSRDTELRRAGITILVDRKLLPDSRLPESVLDVLTEHLGLPDGYAQDSAVTILGGQVRHLPDAYLDRLVGLLHGESRSVRFNVHRILNRRPDLPEPVLASLADHLSPRRPEVRFVVLDVFSRQTSLPPWALGRVGANLGVQLSDVSDIAGHISHLYSLSDWRHEEMQHFPGLTYDGRTAGRPALHRLEPTEEIDLAELDEHIKRLMRNVTTRRKGIEVESFVWVMKESFVNHFAWYIQDKTLHVASYEGIDHCALEQPNSFRALIKQAQRDLGIPQLRNK